MFWNKKNREKLQEPPGGYLGSHPVALAVAWFGLVFFALPAHAATEFVSVVDPGMGSGYDYASLSAWEAGTQTNLTVATTKVFSGTKTGTIDGNGTMYLCRGGAYQTVTANRRRATSTQILVQTISNSSFVFQSGDIWYTNNTCNSAAYFTISDAGDSAINVAKCRSTGGTADTTKVTIDGSTTSAANYVKIYTDPVEGYRHSGKWDDTKYRLTSESYYGSLEISDNYVRVEGLQIEQTAVVSDAPAMIIDALATAANSDVTLDSVLVRGDGTGSGSHGIDIGSGKTTIRNSVIYSNADYGIAAAYGYNAPTVNVENSTIAANGGYGMYTEANLVQVKNSYFGGNTLGTYSYTSDNVSFTTSACSDNTVKSGLTPSIAHSISSGAYFVNVTSGSEDYHIQSASVLKDVGTSQSPTYTTDIDSQSRPIPYGGSWDIGADEEGAKTVFYSVGQDATTNNMTGSPTVTIAVGVATFSVAQTGNIGVGDRITYNVSSIMYISGKISQTQWNVVTNTGQAPLDITGSTVVSITREYTTLSGAEAGATDSNHLNTANLVTGNYVLNLPCYYDTGADTTAVTVNGYTTGSSNYIRIYTPVGTDDSNTSQRHGGKWDDTKYRLTTSAWNGINIYNQQGYTQVDGLQLYNSGGGAPRGFSSEDYANIYLKNSIVRRSGTAIGRGINIRGLSTDNKSGVINCVAYGGWEVGIYVNGFVAPYSFVYNSVSYGNTYGYRGFYAQAFKNCIAANNATSGFSRSSTYDIVLTNCASSDGTADDFDGSDNRVSQTFSFVDYANGDFHLNPTDTGAMNFGVDLSGDADYPFSTDIDGQERPVSGMWDIGADEGNKVSEIIRGTVKLKGNVKFK